MGAPRIVPELTVSDIEASLHFYTAVLGFSVRYERPEDRFAYLERECAELMIEQATARPSAAAELEYPYGRGMHLQIEVDDVDSLHARVVGAHARIYRPMEEKWYRVGSHLAGNRQFGVEEPDGYRLRFFQDLGQRPL